MAWVLFQFIGSILTVIFIVIKEGHISTLNGEQILGQHLGLVFLGNSLAEFLSLGVGTWVVCMLAAPGGKVSSMAGFNTPARTERLLLLAFLLFIALQPFVWFLGWLNALIPLPQTLVKLEQMQDSMIKDFLTGNKVVWLLLIEVALVPALFEEFMFRGFLLNILKRAWGPTLAIIASGVLFGLYHVRFSQLIPLSFLGVMLGVLAWRSGTIYPAMIAHFANNGLGIMMAAYAPGFAFSGNSTGEMPPVIWIVPSILVSACLLYLFIAESKHNDRGIAHVQQKESG